MKKDRTQKLRSKFGPEYDKAIGEHKDRGHAESELQKRAVRVAKFNIHPLEAEDRSRYTEDWRRELSLFVDDPRGAVNHADTLVQDVMRRRGYPVGDFDQNANDLLVGGSPQCHGQLPCLVEDLLVETVEKPEELRK